MRLRQIARTADGERVVVLDANIWDGVLTRPWHWWSPADLVRLTRWNHHKRTTFGTTWQR